MKRAAVKVDPEMIGKPFGKCLCGGTAFLASSLLSYYTSCSSCGNTVIIKKR